MLRVERFSLGLFFFPKATCLTGKEFPLRRLQRCWLHHIPRPKGLHGQLPNPPGGQKAPVAWLTPLQHQGHRHNARGRVWPKLNSWRFGVKAPLTLCQGHTLETSRARRDQLHTCTHHILLMLPRGFLDTAALPQHSDTFMCPSIQSEL